MLGIVHPSDESRGVERASDGARAQLTGPDARVAGSARSRTTWAGHDTPRAAYDEALALFRLALEERHRDGRPRQIRIARWSVSRCLRSLGRLDEALAEQEALREELDALGESDGYVDEEIGECLLAMGRGAEARRAFARAFELLSKNPELQRAEPKRLERLHRLATH